MASTKWRDIPNQCLSLPSGSTSFPAQCQGQVGQLWAAPLESFSNFSDSMAWRNFHVSQVANTPAAYQRCDPSITTQSAKGPGCACNYPHARLTPTYYNDSSAQTYCASNGLGFSPGQPVQTVQRTGHYGTQGDQGFYCQCGDAVGANRCAGESTSYNQYICMTQGYSTEPTNVFEACCGTDNGSKDLTNCSPQWYPGSDACVTSQRQFDHCAQDVARLQNNSSVDQGFSACGPDSLFAKVGGAVSLRDLAIQTYCGKNPNDPACYCQNPDSAPTTDPVYVDNELHKYALSQGYGAQGSITCWSNTCANNTNSKYLINNQQLAVAKNPTTACNIVKGLTVCQFVVNNWAPGSTLNVTPGQIVQNCSSNTDTTKLNNTTNNNTHNNTTNNNHAPVTTNPSTAKKWLVAGLVLFLIVLFLFFVLSSVRKGKKGKQAAAEAAENRALTESALERGRGDIPEPEQG